MLKEIILQDTVRLSQDRLALGGQKRFPGFLVDDGLRRPLLAHTHLHDCFLNLAHQGLILAPLCPAYLLLHHRDIDHMEVVVVHVLPQRLGHGPVALVGVHDRRQNILLSAHNFDCSFVRFGVKLLCEVITAMIVEVSGVYIKDQLAVSKGILFDATGGDHAVGLHLCEHLLIPSGWSFEMDIERRPLQYNVLINIGILLTLVVLLGVADLGCGQPHISCVGTVNTVASRHRQKSSCFRFWVVESGRGTGDALPAGSVITHYDTFIPSGCKASWALPRGCGGFAPGNCGCLPQQGRPLKRAPCTPPKLCHSPLGRWERHSLSHHPASVLRGPNVKGYGLYCLTAISTHRYAP